MTTQEPQSPKVAGRVFLAIISAASGFYLPFLWFISAFIVWTIFSDFEEVKREREFRRKNPPSLRPTPVSSGITALPKQEGTEWRGYFLSLCESPAETAFLEAMIDAFDLTGKAPMQRIFFDSLPLSGKDLTLKLQVPLPPYRVDFLVDDRLVVEIDGAAYHSSPEAVKRDRARDAVLKERGFTVLRIPAKVVFNHPEDAVRRVRETNAARKQAEQAKAKMLGTVKALAPQDQEKSGSIINFFSSFSNISEELKETTGRMREIQNLMQKPKMIFFEEKLLIEHIIKMYQININFEKNMMDENFAKTYNRYISKISEQSGAREEPKKEVLAPTWIEAFPPQPEHPDPVIQQEITATYQSLVEERRKFFDETRSTLQKNPALEQLVDKGLTESRNTRLLYDIWFGA